jgi:hypothetical protein
MSYIMILKKYFKVKVVFYIIAKLILYLAQSKNYTKTFFSKTTFNIAC